MKRIKLSNTFFLAVAVFSLVVSLGTGCGGSSGGGGSGTPDDPDDPPPGEPGEPTPPPPAD